MNDSVITYTVESLKAAQRGEMRAYLAMERTRPSAKRDRLTTIWREYFDHVNDIRRGMGLVEWTPTHKPWIE